MTPILLIIGSNAADDRYNPIAELPLKPVETKIGGEVYRQAFSIESASLQLPSGESLSLSCSYDPFDECINLNVKLDEEHVFGCLGYRMVTITWRTPAAFDCQFALLAGGRERLAGGMAQ